ncbi:hypothetical protein LY12_001534 [Prauserella alba]|nr:hypothetical protein [Prauserella alba]
MTDPRRYGKKCSTNGDTGSSLRRNASTTTPRPRRGGRLVDRVTQFWVRTTGRLVDLRQYSWLDGPWHEPDVLGSDWVHHEATRRGAGVTEKLDSGLLPSLHVLEGDHVDPDTIDPRIGDFYRCTAAWRLELWSQWTAWAWPFGWALSTLFSRRLRQLSLPLRGLDNSRGVDSRVLVVEDPAGVRHGAAWLRDLRATGDTVFSGWYGTVTLPGRSQPSVRVVFPLPNGSLTVLLRPSSSADGGLRLLSPHGEFGDDGAYLVVRADDDHHAWVRRIPVHERFDVFVDDEGILRTDHELHLWRFPVLALHYRMMPRRP